MTSKVRHEFENWFTKYVPSKNKHLVSAVLVVLNTRFPANQPLPGKLYTWC